LDCLISFIPSRASRGAVACLPIFDRGLVRLRRLSRFCETQNRVRIPRPIKQAAAAGLRLVSRIAYRMRPGLGIRTVGWDRPLAPPVETLQAIGGNVEPTRPLKREQATSAAKILVTRAMGGIGDLLMMTPGLHALAESRHGERIVFAVPAKYLPLFEGNPDIEPIDIDGPALDLAQFSKWINFTTCPAALVEAATVPRVRANRIEIFAKAIGLSSRAVRTMDHRPRYFLTDLDRQIQRDFWARHNLTGKSVIGIQFKSQDSYKDYPRMAELVVQ
jgi:hypothetical protein